MFNKRGTGRAAADTQWDGGRGTGIPPAHHGDVGQPRRRAQLNRDRRPGSGPGPARQHVRRPVIFPGPGPGPIQRCPHDPRGAGRDMVDNAGRAESRAGHYHAVRAVGALKRVRARGALDGGDRGEVVVEGTENKEEPRPRQRVVCTQAPHQLPETREVPALQQPRARLVLLQGTAHIHIHMQGH
jgi:hypothetical protein